ncbi:hypothetical protein GCM10010287_30630 [Streptomyces variabilis]|uniref:HTH cro/C1-type domain-containing protein n=2 Tax=Streptomyces variabilis TaxID=67372 RepID=A0ABQ2U1C1_9ACTN|nr:hypothetical protein GCM10010265_39800 [Streptomyces griseoincarnatus]GGT54390.1 hypothetical protein GCM10010287_30630 [Streptomyces variabilis]
MSDPGVGVQHLQRGNLQERAGRKGSHAGFPVESMERILGRAVRERRGKTGMTQARLAELSGMTQAAISRLERGKCMPTFPLLERISRAFEATLLVTVEPGRGVTVTFADPDDGLRQGSETRIRNGLLPGQRNGGAVTARAS